MSFASPRLFDPEADHGMTVADVIGDYLGHKGGHVAAGLITQATYDRASIYCLAFIEDFGHLPVSRCRGSDLKSFLAKHPKYKSPFTKHDAVGAIVSAFRWAVEDGVIPICPYARPRDLPGMEPRQPIQPGEILALLNHARTQGYTLTRLRFRQAVWFLWETGCRTCELYRLDWSHFDPDRGLFELRSKTTGKTGRKRLIVLTRRAARMIGWLWRRAGYPKTGSVFLNGRGRGWNKDTFGHLFRKHANAAGVRAQVSAYSLRHGFTCRALEAGAGERQLADYLGHSSTRYVGWYGRGVRNNLDYLREVASLRPKGK